MSVIMGAIGPDTLDRTAGDDFLYGLADDDTLNGLAGNGLFRPGPVDRLTR